MVYGAASGVLNEKPNMLTRTKYLQDGEADWALTQRKALEEDLRMLSQGKLNK